jgi:hypothetical protein
LENLNWWSVDLSVSAIIWLIDPCRFIRQVSAVPELEEARIQRQGPCHVAWQVNQIRRWKTSQNDQPCFSKPSALNLLHRPDKPAGFVERVLA